MSERIWSSQQLAIYKWFEHGTGNLCIRARAGTGKSTSILEGIEHAPEQNILLCAFNKRIADELTSRLKNPHAEAKTLHSVGFALVRKHWKVQVDEDRGKRLAAQAWAEYRGGYSKDAPDAPAAWIARLAGLVKNSTAAREDILGASAIADVAYTFNIVPEGEWIKDLTVEDLAQMAFDTCMLAQEKDGTIDFDDMVWLPVVHGWGQPTYDLVVIDEAQDTNPVSLALAMNVASGRIAVIGDEMQAIYGFRGADRNAIDRLKKILKAEELPLTTTYRCPKLVVKEAQALCPDFFAADSAPQGKVEQVSEEKMIENIEANDFLLSRLNAPLGSLWLKLIRAGKPARVEGRDLAKGLLATIRRPKVENVADLLVRLRQNLEREAIKLMQTKRKSAEARVEFLRDQLEMIEGLAEGLVTVQELASRIEQMFGLSGAPRACVILSTVHRAKGLEARNVWILTDTLYMRGKRLTDPEERAIHYVSLTRSKENLYLVQGEKA